MGKTKLLSIILPLTIMLSALCSCGYHDEAHGFDDFRYKGNYNSDGELDWVDGLETLLSDYPYKNGDYHYSYEESMPFYNLLERCIYFWEYETDDDYNAAKSFCKENFKDIGDEPLKEYNGYNFYNHYEKLPDYHNNRYPHNFVYTAFNDEKRAIVILGIYSSQKRAEEVAADVQDWEGFLRKYFFEWYSFGN